MVRPPRGCYGLPLERLWWRVPAGRLAGTLVVSFRIPLPSGALLAVVLAEAIPLGLVTGLLARGLALLRVVWRPIAIQVAGSWIAATALLMLGWQLRHPS